MNNIRFWKMSGCGNDFIIIDNRKGVVDEDSLQQLITGACRRKMSVGADGLILVEPSDRVDFKWRYYNSDGSRGEMCGNGARCAGRFAYLNDIAGKQMAFETDAGIIAASIFDDQVKIKMTDPEDLRMDLNLELTSATLPYGFINTGVPHVVISVDDLEAVDVALQGREIRNHADFAPAGANVNFIAPDGPSAFAMRTYERGVEDETLACGTGAVATALISSLRHNLPSPIKIRTRSGAPLEVYFEQKDEVFANVHLQGDARVIYQGKLSEEAWK